LATVSQEGIVLADRFGFDNLLTLISLVRKNDRPVPYLATILITLLLAVPAMSVELFRYRGAAKDGGTLEYVFEAGEQNSPNAVTKEKAAEIAADFVTTFYGVQVGALETEEFRTKPVPFWLVCFSDAIKGPMRQMFFVVLLPDGTVVVPKVTERQ
jgi:hypothetical protein